MMLLTLSAPVLNLWVAVDSGLHLKSLKICHILQNQTKSLTEFPCYYPASSIINRGRFLFHK